jgi:uncharacterized membrane protein
MKSLGERVSYELGQFFIQNVFIVILLVALVLLILDYYHRFLRINNETDHVDLVERYCWLEYVRSRKGRF